jgi:selenoprotein W-related protein
LTADLLKNFEAEIETISLIPSDGGRFEVKINEAMVYSKLATGRHAEPGEILGLVKQTIERGQI